MVYRVAHYLNQFFGGIGGEEHAGAAPILRDGPVGPGAMLQQCLGPRADGGLADAAGGRSGESGPYSAEPRARDAYRHIVPHREAAEDLRGLERARDAAPGDSVGSQTRDGASAERDGARIGRVEAREYVEQRSLSGAVGSDDGVYAAVLHRERHVGKSHDATEGKTHAARPQQYPSPLRGEGRVRGGRGLRRNRWLRHHSRPSPPRQRPDHTLGQPVDRQQEQRSIEDEPVVEQLGQHFGQNGQRHAPRDRPRDAPKAPEEQGEEKQDRGLQREAVG